MFADEHVNKNIPVPLYYQLKNIILNKIKSGELETGTCIPTELELQEMFDVSRTTVRQAMTDLVNEGFLTRVKGKGTFVSKPKVMNDFLRKLESFDDQIRKRNMVPSTKVNSLSIVASSADVQENLKTDPNENVILLDRIRYANNEPVVLVHTYLSLSCSEVLKYDFNRESLYHVLSNNESTKIVRVFRKLEAVNAGRDIAKILNIEPETAVLLTKTIGYNAQDVPEEYSIAWYPADKNMFVIELTL